MCADFVSHMIQMIDKSVAEKKKIDDTLVEECMQHIRFCQTKCESFHGREETLEVSLEVNNMSTSSLLYIHVY